MRDSLLEYAQNHISNQDLIQTFLRYLENDNEYSTETLEVLKAEVKRRFL